MGELPIDRSVIVSLKPQELSILKERMFALVPGKILSFSPDNEIVYAQDFKSLKGVPGNMGFEVKELLLPVHKIKLVGLGYGLHFSESSYVNGAIFITYNELAKNLKSWIVTQEISLGTFEETASSKERIPRPKLFMEIAKLLAERSTCTRAKVGALLVKDDRIISTGYVGAPSGEAHCLDIGCEIGETGGCVRTVHAEANVIAFAAKQGIKTDDTSLYVTLSPCIHCAKLLVNAGIREVIYLKEYRDTSGLDLLRRRGIRVTQYKEEP